jgi:hypothetical protein
MGFFLKPDSIYAAKKFVTKKTAGKTVISSGSIPSIVKYRSDKLGILFSFANFNGIESANYSFTYNSNGNPQGAGGTIRASNNPTSERELLFGTCSTSVCTYHSGLTNARLVLTVKMTNGNTVTKSYRIKTYR